MFIHVCWGVCVSACRDDRVHEPGCLGMCSCAYSDVLGLRGECVRFCVGGSVCVTPLLCLVDSGLGVGVTPPLSTPCGQWGHPVGCWQGAGASSLGTGPQGCCGFSLCVGEDAGHVFQPQPGLSGEGEGRTLKRQLLAETVHDVHTFYLIS